MRDRNSNGLRACGYHGDRHVLAAATAASRLSRTFVVLVETLRRLRSGGSQVIRIERVDVRDGGQAITWFRLSTDLTFFWVGCGRSLPPHSCSENPARAPCPQDWRA